MGGLKRLKECNPGNLESLLAESEPLLLHFGTDWCTPCKRLERVLLGLNEAIAVRVAKVNVEDHPEIAKQFSVTKNPTLCVVKEGEVAGRHEGFLEAEGVLALVGRHAD
jgi:thioredoxin 1